MPARPEAFAPGGQGWLELWAIWHGWCRNEGAISLQYASEISFNLRALILPSATSQERSGKAEERSAR
jgi:hypothetical protein